VPCKKAFFTFKLVDRPAAGKSQRDDCPDCSRLDHRTKSLVVVNPELLSEPAKDPVGFVSPQGVISIELVPENSLPSNGVTVWWLLHQFPTVIG
jgi:hypothetical protein